MRTFIAALVVAVVLTGCAFTTMRYNPDTKEVKVTYFRCLTANDSIEANIGGNTVKANGQKNNVEAIQSLVETMRQIYFPAAQVAAQGTK